MPFADDLNRFGPAATNTRTLSQSEARAYCARLTAWHYENFSVLTWLTPRALRPAFQSIYAFCRWSDDLADEVGDPDRSRELLGWWRGELHAMYQGQTRHPVMIALAPTVAEFAIPIAPFEALISAFEQDQVVTDYATYAQLLDYCSRSANPVGHLVLYVARSYTEENARLADATCTALQLTNFWQDVGRDLALGRIYLPREDRDRFGYSVKDLKKRQYNSASAALIAFEVLRTRRLFETGRALISRVPPELAIDIDLFTRGGLAILDKIKARGFDVLSRRPRLSKPAKLGLFARALLAHYVPFARPAAAVVAVPVPPLAGEAQGREPC
jgi:squalene synthase HpnC